MIFTNGLVTIQWKTIHADRVIIFSLTIQVEADACTVEWLAIQSDINIIYAIILTDSMNLLNKNSLQWAVPVDWHMAMHSLCGRDKFGVTALAMMVDRLANTLDITAGFLLGRAERLEEPN